MRKKPKQLDTPEKVLDAIARIGEEPLPALWQLQEAVKAMECIGTSFREVIKATASQFALLGKTLQCPKKGPRP